MANRIVLLTAREEAPLLVDWLCGRAPGLAVIQARTRADLARALSDRPQDTRLLSFLSNVVVPADLLRPLGPEPYNIHPGPPELPGARPEERALAAGHTAYGVTAHVMVEAVDSGPIVYATRFPIPPGIARLAFADLIYSHAIRAFGLVAAHCAATPAPLPRLDTTWRLAA